MLLFCFTCAVVFIGSTFVTQDLPKPWSVYWHLWPYLDLIFYLDYPTIQEDYNDLMKVVYIVVESILGEKVLHENINFVELSQLENSCDEGLIPLYDLQFYLEEINQEPAVTKEKGRG